MRDAGERPAACEAVCAQKSVKRQLVLIADDKVLLDVERGDRVAERRVERVDFFGGVGGLVERFAVGVGGGKLEPPAGVPRAEFERIVVGVADGGLLRIAAKVGPERTTRTVDHAAADGVVGRVFAIGTAGEGAGLHFTRLAQAQTQSGVAGIGLRQHTLVVACIAYIGHTEDGFGTGLPLDREGPLLGVRRGVVDVVAGDAADGFVGSPVYVCIRLLPRGTERRKGVGERLPVILAAVGVDERRREERLLVGVGGAVRSIGSEHTDGERVDGGVELAEACANACGSRCAQQPGQ